MSMDAMRREYAGPVLREDQVPEAPAALFAQWFEEASQADPHTANAMTLATVDASGCPDARIVLLKGVDAAFCFRFFSVKSSAKGQQLADHSAAALVFHWSHADRQVRVRGTVSSLPTDVVAAYFASRPRSSQIAAACLPQGTLIKDRQALDQAYADLHEQLGADEPVPLPEYWSGYSLVVEEIEFWQGQPSRLHDRLVYQANGNHWTLKRLAP